VFVEEKLIEDYVDAGVTKAFGKGADALFLGVVGLTIADEETWDKGGLRRSEVAFKSRTILRT